MNRMKLTTLAVAGALAVFGNLPAFGQENAALIDALVRKGVLTDQEAEEIRADLVKEYAETDAGKIKLNSSLSELKLSGDTRMRFQYDNKQAQLYNDGNDRQRNRWRFRLRLNADYKFAGPFWGGVQLQTGNDANSANQTFTNGYRDYDIYISKVFLGWEIADWAQAIIGKQDNPFYTTNMVWDSDITPQGAVEILDFHKLFGWESYTESTGYSKDGKGGKEIVSGTRWNEPAWSLTLNAGQFWYYDNDQSNLDSDANTDAAQFVAQLVFGYDFGNHFEMKFAPGWQGYIASGVETADTLVDEPYKQGNGTDNVLGSVRDLSIVTAPGEFGFPLFGEKAAFIWDFAYNFKGDDRAKNVYGIPTGAGFRDSSAYLVGLKIGKAKKAGTWEFGANWRQVGFASLNPNQVDSDWNLGLLNAKGIETKVAYAITDYITFGITYMYSWNLDKTLEIKDPSGPDPGVDGLEGRVTGGNTTSVLQVDLNWKF